MVGHCGPPWATVGHCGPPWARFGWGDDHERNEHNVLDQNIVEGVVTGVDLCPNNKLSYSTEKLRVKPESGKFLEAPKRFLN